MLIGLSALSVTGQARTGSAYTVEGYTPPLVLDFERSVFNANGTSSTASSAYTSTRTGLATQLDASGNLVWNAHNLALNSATPATQSITVVSGADYTVECTGSGSITLSGAGTGSVTEGNPVEITASTTTLTLTVVGSLDTMWAYRSDLGGMAPVPLTRRVAGSTTYVPTTSAAVYLPREEAYAYVSGSLVGPYLQLESDTRTNNLKSSDDLSNASYWTPLGGASTPTSATAIMGAPAWNLSGVGYLRQSGLSLSASTKYTVWTRILLPPSPSLGKFRFRIYDANTTTFITLENGSTVSDFLYNTSGVVVRDTSADDHLVSEGDGVYLVGTSFTTLATLTTMMLFIYADTNATQSVIAATPQLEEGPIPTSYIPTSGSTVTRSADSTTISAGNMPYPTPQVIGPELVTNGTFDTDTDWSGISGWTNGVISGGQITVSPITFNGAGQAISGLTIGNVYKINAEVISSVAPAARLYVGSAANPGTSTIINQGFLTPGSYEFYFVATATSHGIGLSTSNGTDSVVFDNISVREINPLALSFQLEGLVTYADENLGDEVRFYRWELDSSNRITSYLYTAVGTGTVIFRQVSSGVVEQVPATPTSDYSPGINVPFNIASRHGSTFINGAVDGTALTADLTPTALPDLSATTFDLAPTFNGFIKEFRVWADDIGDTGIAEAST